MRPINFTAMKFFSLFLLFICSCSTEPAVTWTHYRPYQSNEAYELRQKQLQDTISICNLSPVLGAIQK